MKQIAVAAAILINEGHILCVKKGGYEYDYISYHYEFPGGKLEQGESAKEALHRELLEELELDFPSDKMEEFMTVHHQYPDFEITLHTFLCPVDSRKIQIWEHVDVQWLSADQLDQLHWLSADASIVEALMKRDNSRERRGADEDRRESHD